MTATVPENKKAACATYVEQTKLLVTLASAFIVAPAAFVTLQKDRAAAGLGQLSLGLFVTTEICFVLSVLMGYVVLGTVAGSQDNGSFDVFRKATRVSSLIQLGAYILGLTLFVWTIARAF